jgi:hypothetical protein
MGWGSALGLALAAQLAFAGDYSIRGTTDKPLAIYLEVRQGCTHGYELKHGQKFVISPHAITEVGERP